MAESSMASFRVTCPDCNVEQASDEFTEIKSFVANHHKHTGHNMEWVEAEFGEPDEPRPDWQIECDVCNDKWEFETKKGAENFEEEHAQYTDHTVTTGPKAVVTNEFDEKSVKGIIYRLEEDIYEDGVPEKEVYTLLNENGVELSEITKRIRTLRHKGEIYEPKSGILRKT